jgi:hypothetical protein
VGLLGLSFLNYSCNLHIKKIEKEGFKKKVRNNFKVGGFGVTGLKVYTKPTGPTIKKMRAKLF